MSQFVQYLMSNPDSTSPSISNTEKVEATAKEVCSSLQNENDNGTSSKTTQAIDEGEKTAESSVFSGWGFPSISLSAIVDTVVKQSEYVVDVYKRDISEFVGVVSSESSNAVETVSSKLQGVSKNLVASVETLGRNNSLINGIDDESHDDTKDDSKVDDDDENEAEYEGQSLVSPTALAEAASDLVSRFSNLLQSAVTVAPSTEVRNRKKIIYDKRSTLIAAIRVDPTTYLQDPSNPESNPIDPEECHRYREFSSTFNVAEHAAKIAQLLSEDPDMEKLMDRIVPSQVSHEDFWTRYFFRIAEMEREEERRKNLMQDAAQQYEDDFAWDSDDEGDDAKKSKESPSIANNDMTIPESQPDKSLGNLQPSTIPSENSNPNNTSNISNPSSTTSSPIHTETIPSSSPLAPTNPHLTSTSPDLKSDSTPGLMVDISYTTLNSTQAKLSMESIESFEIVSNGGVENVSIPDGVPLEKPTTTVNNVVEEEDTDWGGWD